MRSSQEIKNAAKAAGLECSILRHGTSFRAGGTIIIHPYGWRDMDSVSVRKTGTAFDTTGYDGRGREYSVFVISDGGEWRSATEGEYEAVPEGERMVLGIRCSESRSTDGAIFLVKTTADVASDLDVLLGFTEPEELGNLGDAFPRIPVRFVNMTPHSVKLNDGREFLPSGQVARVSNEFGEFDSDGIADVKFGAVTGLPEPEIGVVYIASAMVAAAVKGIRSDIVSPATGHPAAIRENGQIVSVPGFVRQ